MTTDTITDALYCLNAIDDETWERVCGSQDRAEFARLAIDLGEDVGEAWLAALAHADSL